MLSGPGRATWTAGALMVSAIIILPAATIAVLSLKGEESIWPQLAATVLPVYVMQTVGLMAGVGVLSFVIGSGTAWLITMYRFPGRRVLKWALVLPLAIPTYIAAYCFLHVFDYAGPVQSALRAIFGWSRPGDYRFPELRSLPGAIGVLSFVLYPYVYLTARASFLKQGAAQIEVARTLGAGIPAAFRTIALPLARPAIVAGVSLAMMECLNDIGAVEFFGVRTLSVGVYTTWLGKGNLAGAAQLAAVMLVFVVGLIVLERSGRKAGRLDTMSRKEVPLSGIKLQGGPALAAAIACAVPIIAGFLLPAGVLLSFAFQRGGLLTTQAFGAAAINSISVSAIAAGVILLAGLFIAYAQRLARTPAVSVAIWLVTAGYAIPGAVLGMGVLVPLAAFDNGLDAIMRGLFGVSTGLILTGSVAALIYAYSVRFLAIALGSLEAGLGRVAPSLGAAARTLGRGPIAALVEIDLPLLRPALMSAALLVFVEAMKELSATLILRPFNFETLATLVYAQASLDQLEDTGLAALTIVAVGIAPVIMLTRMMSSVRR
ncbi:MAG TPA: iron ABC transporter permease [Aestuariivirgaceae bacterium]|nr:iron ABC transporter permease [Aestuariivirgaceae bacterium]